MLDIIVPGLELGNRMFKGSNSLHVEQGGISGTRFPRTGEEESFTGKYTKGAKSSLGLRKPPKVSIFRGRIGPLGRSFSVVRATANSHGKLAGDPKSIYFHKYNRDIPSRGS
jgi:hypothetical protein